MEVIKGRKEAGFEIDIREGVNAYWRIIASSFGEVTMKIKTAILIRIKDSVTNGNLWDFIESEIGNII